MTAIHVCSLARLDETLRTSGASHVVSLVAEGTDLPPPAGIEVGCHLDIRISDISEAMEGQVLAEASHVRTFLRFLGTWRQEQPLVIHCYAGISRSTAAAYIALCHLKPDMTEADHAAALRRASATATPNRRLVGLADGLMDRGGRMVEAVDSIGRGREAFEGTPFMLALGT